MAYMALGQFTPGNDMSKNVKLVARAVKKARAGPIAVGDIGVLVNSADSTGHAHQTIGRPQENAARRDFVDRCLKSGFFTYFKTKKNSTLVHINTCI